MPDFILHQIKPWLNASSEMAWMSPQSTRNLSSWRSWNKCHHCSHLFLWNALLPHPSFLLAEDTMALCWLVKKVALLEQYTCPSVWGSQETWTVCALLSLEMPWQGSCLLRPNASNWKSLKFLSISNTKWCFGFTGRQNYLSQPLTPLIPLMLHVLPAPGEKTHLNVRKGEISDCWVNPCPFTPARAIPGLVERSNTISWSHKPW